jgi:hypothetical protein
LISQIAEQPSNTRRPTIDTPHVISHEEGDVSDLVVRAAESRESILAKLRADHFVSVEMAVPLLINGESCWFSGVVK